MRAPESVFALALRTRFATDDWPVEARARLWGEDIRRRADFDVVDRSAHGLCFCAERVALGAVTVGIVRGTPSVFVRRVGAADKVDGVSVVIVRHGVFRRVHNGGMVELAPGDAAVFDRDGGELHWPDDGEAWWMDVSRDMLAPLLRGFDGAVDSQVGAADPALRLLVGYLDTLFALETIADPALAGIHVADLLAGAIARGEADAGRAAGGGFRGARLRSLLDLIARHAGDPDLSPPTVAARLGVSARYVHKLMKNAGLTFSEYLLDRRMERVLRLLRDPRLDHRRIGELALEAGFSDLSHFNRCFRRRFGATPSQIRGGARGGDAGDRAEG